MIRLKLQKRKPRAYAESKKKANEIKDTAKEKAEDLKDKAKHTYKKAKDKLKKAS